MKYIPEGKKSSIKSLLQVLMKVTVMIYGKKFQSTVQMGVLIFKLLILISPIVQWHIMTTSESTLLSWLFIGCGPDQDVPFDIIICYISEKNPTLLE